MAINIIESVKVIRGNVEKHSKRAVVGINDAASTCADVDDNDIIKIDYS